jgi:hypothetical protein
MLQKHEILSGRYLELIGYFFDLVSDEYVKNETKYINVPDTTIKKQFDEMLEKNREYGLISYCEVLEHGDDPKVKLVNVFVFIEDVFNPQMR